MVLFIVLLAVVVAAVVAGIVVLSRRSGTVVPGPDPYSAEVREFSRAVYDSRSVHSSAAMGDLYHR